MKTSTVTQKCKTCKGDLVFNIADHTLVCQKCGDKTSIVNFLTPTEKSFHELLTKAPVWGKDTRVFQCENCGAKSVITKFDLVVDCEYCGAKKINKTKEMPGACPDSIVLFLLTPDEAEQRARTWLSKRFFMPGDFKELAKKKQVSGIYFPAFTFDIDVSTHYQAVAVQTKTITATIDGKSYSRSHTYQRDVMGNDEHRFDEVIVMANDIIQPETIKALQPFVTELGGVAFQQEFLSGYTICQASKEPLESWGQAKKIAEDFIQYKINRMYPGYTLQNLQMEVGINNVTYKYVLLPIYLRHIEYKGQRYEMYINGQTGRVYGKVPRACGKVFSFFAKAFTFAAITLGIILAIIL